MKPRPWRKKGVLHSALCLAVFRSQLSKEQVVRERAQSMLHGVVVDSRQEGQNHTRLQRANRSRAGGGRWDCDGGIRIVRDLGISRKQEKFQDAGAEGSEA